jgi:hypothetical protein
MVLLGLPSGRVGRCRVFSFSSGVKQAGGGARPPRLTGIKESGAKALPVMRHTPFLVRDRMTFFVRDPRSETGSSRRPRRRV